MAADRCDFALLFLHYSYVCELRLKPGAACSENCGGDGCCSDGNDDSRCAGGWATVDAVRSNCCLSAEHAKNCQRCEGAGMVQMY